MSVRIGVAGPSCSGKSTVARTLAAALGGRHLCLDDYYRRDHRRRYVPVGGDLIRSYDHPAAYDGETLLRDVAAEHGPVVAEGFLLFAYPAATDAFDLRIFVGIPWSEVVRRRGLRTGQTTAKVDATFDLIGESEWARFGEPQADLPGVMRMDGGLGADVLAGRALDLVRRIGRHVSLM